MGLKDICTTQETSRKLKEAGFPQEGGIAYWLPLSGEHLYTNNPGEDWKLGLQIDRTDWFYIPNRCAKERSHTKYRAFTFNELWDLLPKEINFLDSKTLIYHLEIKVFFNHISIGYFRQSIQEGELLTDSLRSKRHKVLQEAAAELALWCVKEGYLNLKERE